MLATPPATNGNANPTSVAQAEAPDLHNPFEQKPLPTGPAVPAASPPPSVAKPPLSDTQRASISFPGNLSSNLGTGGRFYSQFRSAPMNEMPTGPHQAGVLSPPHPGQSRSPSPMSVHENRPVQPLSPLEELQDHQVHELQEQLKHEPPQFEPQDSQLGTLSENQEQEEHEEHQDRVHHQPHGHTSKAQNEHEHVQRHEMQANGSEQSLAPQPHVLSHELSKSAAPSSEHNPRLSNASMVSSHPHRSEEEARVVNDPPRPVELAITADDSSEEIVMSPTSYPGQEWAPMYH